MMGLSVKIVSYRKNGKKFITLQNTEGSLFSKILSSFMYE